MIPLLKGLRILDLTAVILGPYGTQILGDLGAEVIKVEPPEGDSMRPVAPVAAPGISAIFSNFNRNKRSVALDLKREAGRTALMKLLPTADAFVHNMRQDAIDKLGFTFKAVRAANPRIIYAAAIGFGRHGRYAGK
ncbi:MAG TPA: CoA transferase, partial [Hyphomicrobiaceae bacterium]|nr:CoA transferase [Hyphomicrobiaceae bacterium]